MKYIALFFVLESLAFAGYTTFVLHTGVQFKVFFLVAGIFIAVAITSMIFVNIEGRTPGNSEKHKISFGCTFAALVIWVAGIVTLFNIVGQGKESNPFWFIASVTPAFNIAGACLFVVVHYVGIYFLFGLMARSQVKRLENR